MKIEDAIKRYESWAEDDRIDVLIRKEHRQMADWLKELKADRPQGEWISTEERETLVGSIDWEIPRKYRLPKCSLCGEEFGTSAYKYRFCPNCGARMKGK